MANVNQMSEAERKAYRDAYGIAYVGAANPSGVALTIHETISALYREGYGTNDAARHPAVVAMVGHLAALTGQGLGPESDVLRRVQLVYTLLTSEGEETSHGCT